MTIFDVSVTLSPRTPVWPGVRACGFGVERRSLPGGGEAVTTRLDLIAHAGTHVDAPLHFCATGRSIEQVALAKLLGPCRVFEHAGKDHIGPADLQRMGFTPVRRALFKTANSARVHRGEIGQDYISFLPEALAALIAGGVEVLGIDGLAIGPYGDLSDANHVAFCGAGGLIVEMLDLSNVPPGDYVMLALPLRLEGVEASPARVVLVQDAGLERAFAAEEHAPSPPGGGMDTIAKPPRGSEPTSGRRRS
jgi:arylformamidase